MKSNKIISAIVFSGAVISFNINAQERIRPGDACNFLESQPYITTVSSYSPLYEGSDDFMCGTKYFDITYPGVIGLPNNIAYYGRGSKDEINKMMIMLNVNDTRKPAVQMAKSLYINGAFELLKKVFPDNPGEVADIVKIISDNKVGEWNINMWTITSVKENWPTGKGYEYRFTIIK